MPQYKLQFHKNKVNMPLLKIKTKRQTNLSKNILTAYYQVQDQNKLLLPKNTQYYFVSPFPQQNKLFYQATINSRYKFTVGQFHNNSQKLNQRMEKQTSFLWKKVQLAKSDVNQPSPRWGHASCVIDDQIVFFGGYADSKYMNDMWIFNSSTLLWTQLEVTGDIPQNRSNCTMNYDSERRRIIIFGGGGPNKKRFNSIHVLDWNTKVWKEIQPKENSKTPIERTYHTSEFISNYLITFGGEAHWDLDDLWIFNFESEMWTQIVIQDENKPSARRFHSSALVDNEMYIIGGCYNKYRSLSNIFSLDLSSLITTGEYSKLRWRQKKVKDSSFLTRWGHSSSVFDGKIYIFAGRFSNDLNDLLVYDIQAGTIKNIIRNLKQAPTPRRRHCATFIGSSLVVFGGFNGEYFNDLHYINIQSTSQTWVKKSQILFTINNSIDNQNFSDAHVICKDGLKLHFSLQLLAKGLEDNTKIPNFIQHLKERTKGEGLQLIEFIYNGHGDICEDTYLKYKIKGSLNQKLDIRSYYTNLNNCLKKDSVNSSIASCQQQSGVIELTLEQWTNAIDVLQQGMDSDVEFQFNQQIVRCSSVLLKINSKYYRNLFQFSQESSIRLRATSSYLKYVILFILTDYLIVPNKLSTQELVELIRLSKFYRLERLTSICQSYMLKTGCDSEQILKVAIENNLEKLQHFCAQQEIRRQFLSEKSNQNLQFSFYDSKQPKLTRLQSQVVDCKRKALKKCYFDIQQTKAVKNRLQDIGMKKRASLGYKECEKENSQINF